MQENFIDPSGYPLHEVSVMEEIAREVEKLDRARRGAGSACTAD